MAVNNLQLAIQFFLQLAVILGCCRIAGLIAARATGLLNREALGIGTLMNARGLMELIIITLSNIASCPPPSPRALRTACTR